MQLYSTANDSLDEYLNSKDDIISVSANGHIVMGLKKDGTVVTAGRLPDSVNNAVYRIDTGDWKNIIEIASGQLYIVGLREDGTITAQGHGLKADGTAVAVGSNNNGQCKVRDDQWTDIVAISAGADHTVGLKKNGEVVTTRKEDPGALKEWKDKDIIAVAAGYRFTLRLQRNGKVIGIGYETNGQRKTDNWEDVSEFIEAWNSKF